MTSDVQELLKRARAVAAHAYAPYSREPKGAAVLAANGKIYTGASVEIASWAGSICAEAAALASAVADGQQAFKTLAVVPYRFPCGTCLQLLREFGTATEIVTSDAEGNVSSHQLSDLLPSSFGADNLTP